MKIIFKKSIAAAVLFLFSAICSRAQIPQPIGKHVEVGGHLMHVHCTGKGHPTVVVENGFDEFSFDWVMVQTGVEKFTRICTYDRAGYAWSEPGPMPRTFDQINLDLKSALKSVREKPPFLLVGHSFGGQVIRNFAVNYRKDVAGLVFAESVGDAHRIIMGPKTARIADFAQHREIPKPHLEMTLNERHGVEASKETPVIEPPLDRLPMEFQKAHVWALSQPYLEAAESSERDWSPEYLANWLAHDQKGSLGDLPVVVLAREKGGFGEGHDLSAAELERQRRKEQADLAALSTRGKLFFVDSGHEIELDAPETVIKTIHDMVIGWRKNH